MISYSLQFHKGNGVAFYNTFGNTFGKTPFPIHQAVENSELIDLCILYLNAKEDYKQRRITHTHYVRLKQEYFTELSKYHIPRK